MPKLEYPTFFDGGLVGVKAKSEIRHREAFLFVPQTMVISVQKCLEFDILKPVFEEDIFTKKH